MRGIAGTGTVTTTTGNDKGAASAAETYPTYSNPVNPSERVRVWDPEHDDPDKDGFVRPRTVQFAYGAFTPRTALENDSVRRALRTYGPTKPDEWSGSDLKEPFVCGKCHQFTTRNYAAREHHRDVRHAS